MRLRSLLNTLLGREPGSLDLPRDGNAPSDRRQFLAIVLITLFVMAFGLSIVFFEIGFDIDDVTPTPVSATPAASSRLPVVVMSNQTDAIQLRSELVLFVGRVERL